MKKKLKNSDNFRHTKLTLKVRILQTAEDQKQFKVVCMKNIFDYKLLIYICLDCVGDHREPPQPWTL